MKKHRPESILAKSFDEAGSPWTRAHGTTSVNVTTATNLAGEARPPGNAKHRARTDSEFAVSSVGESGGAGPGEAKLRKARQLAETPEARAAWDRISRMPDSAEKDALLEEFRGTLQLCDDGVS